MAEDEIVGALLRLALGCRWAEFDCPLRPRLGERLLDPRELLAQFLGVLFYLSRLSQQRGFPLLDGVFLSARLGDVGSAAEE